MAIASATSPGRWTKMSVLSKLLYGLIPKSVAGLVLCVIPIATVIVVVMYPQAVMKMLLRDEPAEIGPLLKSTKVGIDPKKKKRRSPKLKGNKKEESKGFDSAGTSAEKQHETEEEDMIVVDDEEFLLQLASIQGKVPIAPKEPKIRSVSPPSTDSPVFNSVELNEVEKWSRVPTRQEEIIANLRNRVALLTRQLEDTERDSKSLCSKLEKEHVRANESEQELKDRTRAYQIRWVEMEGEISALKMTNTELMGKLDGLAAAQEHSTDQRNSFVDTLQCRIRELETLGGTVPGLKKLILVHEETERQLRAQIGHLEAELARAVESVHDEKMVLKQEKEDLNTKIFDLEGQVFSLKASKDQLLSEISLLNEQLEASRTGATAISDTNDRLTKEISAKEEKLEELRDTIENITAKLESLDLELRKKEEIEKVLGEENGKLREELKSAGEQTIQTKKELAECLEDIEESKEKVDQRVSLLQDELDKCAGKLGKQEEELVRLESIKQAFETVQNERFELAAKLEQEEKLVKDYRVQHEKAERKLAILQSVCESKYTAYKEDIATLLAEKDLLRTKLDGFARSTEIVEQLVSESS